MSDFGDNLEPYEPPECLWQLIKSVANEKELDVIKSIIGESLVETSIDLHHEVDSLLEIWRDYRNETQTSLNQIKQNFTKNSTSLPEPPNIRLTLKKEIQFFVKQMREQFKEEESFRRQILNNKHNLNVINYVLNSNVGPSRGRSEQPRSARDRRTGSETPTNERSQSRQRLRYTTASRCGSASSSSNNRPNSELNKQNTAFNEDLELLVDEEKINCMQIDQIADHLRELLQTECDTLIKDIDFLYECIDKENEYRESSKRDIKEPSLNELKEERRKLEEGLLSSTGKNQAQISRLPASVSSRGVNSPVVITRETPSPPGSATSFKSRVSVASNKVAIVEVKNTQRPVVTSKNEASSKRSSSVSKSETDKLNAKQASSIYSIPQIKVDNKLASALLNKDLNDTRPSFTRTNSVSSVASSVSSLSSSTSSRLSSVQKLRQMVLDSRDN